MSCGSFSNSTINILNVRLSPSFVLLLNNTVICLVFRNCFPVIHFSISSSPRFSTLFTRLCSSNVRVIKCCSCLVPNTLCNFYTELPWQRKAFLTLEEIFPFFQGWITSLEKSIRKHQRWSGSHYEHLYKAKYSFTLGPFYRPLEIERKRKILKEM